MDELDIKTAKTVTRTVRIELSEDQVEAIVAEHVMRENRSKLRDFGLKCEIEYGTDAAGHGLFSCVVTGTATRES